MKLLNKSSLLKYVFLILLSLISFLLILLIINFNQYKIYTRNYNNKLNTIMSLLVDKYPDITKEELINIINNDSVNEISVLKEYGIDLENDNLLMENLEVYISFTKIIIIVVFVLIIVLMIIILLREYFRLKKVNEITKILEQINRKNYKLDLDDSNEDELAILKSEIYKTTLMLKEQAENSIQDKVNLKNSLSDISHQLKTPLTSINIMLDNILDNRDMEEEIRIGFINDIKREIININFLVVSILKLSRLDANVVKFNVEKIKLKDIVNSAIKNVSSLCDLKGVSIEVIGNENIKILGDFNWQVEAITNILKNCVEYSKDNSSIEVRYISDKICSELIIKDCGKGISKQDLKHIFERFYKGTNSSNDSVGIGLALSKSIIEQGNGSISVQSELNKGTIFTIRYYE